MLEACHCWSVSIATCLTRPEIRIQYKKRAKDKKTNKQTWISYTIYCWRGAESMSTWLHSENAGRILWLKTKFFTKNSHLALVGLLPTCTGIIKRDWVSMRLWCPSVLCHKISCYSLCTGTAYKSRILRGMTCTQSLVIPAFGVHCCITFWSHNFPWTGSVLYELDP